MQKVIGPVGGYYAVIFARELDGELRASYKVCASEPANYDSAPALRRRRVGGPSKTLAEALDFAEQLARLHMARLSDEDESRSMGKAPALHALEFDTSIGEETPVPRRASLYAPTEPAPLYAATMPCPLR